jgi:hypothetical protein
MKGEEMKRNTLNKILGIGFVVLFLTYMSYLLYANQNRPKAVEVPVTVLEMVDIGDAYVPNYPVSSPDLISEYWDLYTLRMTRDYPYEMSVSKYGNPRDNSTYQGKCQTLLENYPYWSSNVTTYKSLFHACTGEDPQENSIGYLWSLYGMGTGGVWTNGSNSPSDWVVDAMTFTDQPPNSVVLGVLTPCDESYPELMRGMKIENVFPAREDFSTLYNRLYYDNEVGLEISFSYNGEVRSSTLSLLEGSFFGFIESDLFFPQEWDVRDNEPMEIGTIYLYKVEGCR